MHLMIDNETIDITPSAVVTQIGIVAFNITSNDILATHKTFVDIDDQLINGRTIAGDTFKWWLKQSEAARRVQWEADDSPSQDFAMGNIAITINEWIKKFGPIEGVWSNGATFDIPQIESMMNQSQVQIPWGFWQHRDIRTLDFLSPMSHRPTAEIAHDALSDAIAQTLWVQNMYKDIKGS